MRPAPPSAEIVTDPVHRQLARACRAEIANGALRTGEPFPSERDLAKRFKVSRATANKVISNLVAEGMLLLRPGIGTFVAPNRGLHASLRQMESFTDRARAVGKNPETEVICLRKGRARALPDDVRDALGLDGRAAVHYFERLRLADREPVILEHRWVPADVVPGLTTRDLQGSFYHYLEENHGVYLTGERHKIYAKNLTPDEARRFRLVAGAAVLAVTGVGLTETDRPVWYQTLFYRGDRYELENEVNAARGPGRWTVQLRT